jgi:hypothetical protein
MEVPTVFCDGVDVPSHGCLSYRCLDALIFNNTTRSTLILQEKRTYDIEWALALATRFCPVETIAMNPWFSLILSPRLMNVGIPLSSFGRLSDPRGQ